MGILDLIFPKRCVSCGKWGKYFCNICFRKLHYIEFQICPYCGKRAIDGMTHYKCRKVYGLDGLYAPLYFRGAIKKAIHLIKFDHVSDLISSLITVAFPYFPKYLAGFDLLIPVPLHRKREKERGYNQSRLIAKNIGERFRIPVVNLLIRGKYTQAQANLKLVDRRENIKNVFEFSSRLDISGKSIILVDDVATSRLTLIECAKVLKRNGAVTVWGLVIAHG